MLTPKQRAYLRSLASQQDAVFQIGKSGITPQLITQLYDVLEARELIKITVLKNSGIIPADALAQLAEKTGSEPVACIGNKIILYKKSRENQKIFLS